MKRHRSPYFVDGELRPYLRGAEAAWLRSSGFLATIFCIYFAIATYHLAEDITTINDFYIYVLLRCYVVGSFYGSIVYTDWLHNLDIKHDGTLNTASIELYILRWDMWFVGSIMFSVGSYIRLTAPSSSHSASVGAIVDVDIDIDFDAMLTNDNDNDNDSEQLLVFIQLILFALSSYFLYNVRLDRIMDEREWSNVSAERLARGKGTAVLRNKNYNIAKIFLGLQFFACSYTAYIKHGWLNSYVIVSLQSVGFVFFLLKTRVGSLGGNDGEQQEQIYSESYPGVRFLVKFFKFEEIGGHEFFHVLTHLSWVVFLVGDVLRYT
jgi:hypothetical protein